MAVGGPVPKRRPESKNLQADLGETPLQQQAVPAVAISGVGVHVFHDCLKGITRERHQETREPVD